MENVEKEKRSTKFGISLKQKKAGILLSKIMQQENSLLETTSCLK